MKPFCLLLAVLLLIGCAATLHDARQGPPLFTLSSDLSAKELANKIAYESTQESINSKLFPSWNPAQIFEFEDTYKLLITFTSRGNILLIPYPPIPVAELIIVPAKSGCYVEYRAINWTDKNTFWDLVKKCASPHNLSFK